MKIQALTTYTVPKDYCDLCHHRDWWFSTCDVFGMKRDYKGNHIPRPRICKRAEIKEKR